MLATLGKRRARPPTARDCPVCPNDIPRINGCTLLHDYPGDNLIVVPEANARVYRTQVQIPRSALEMLRNIPRHGVWAKKGTASTRSGQHRQTSVHDNTSTRLCICATGESEHMSSPVDTYPQVRDIGLAARLDRPLPQTPEWCSIRVRGATQSLPTSSPKAL